METGSFSDNDSSFVIVFATCWYLHYQIRSDLLAANQGTKQQRQNNTTGLEDPKN